LVWFARGLRPLSLFFRFGGGGEPKPMTAFLCPVAVMKTRVTLTLDSAAQWSVSVLALSRKLSWMLAPVGTRVPTSFFLGLERVPKRDALFDERIPLATSRTHQVRVTLRPTVSRPVRLGVRHPSGTRDQFFFLLEIFFRQLLVCYFVAPSLTRGRVCNLLLLLVLDSTVPLRSELKFNYDRQSVGQSVLA
jgi:hypothetical protein